MRERHSASMGCDRAVGISIDFARGHRCPDTAAKGISVSITGQADSAAAGLPVFQNV